MKLVAINFAFSSLLSAHAGQHALSHELLLLIAQTNSTHIDLNSDGVPDLIRRYNRDGELVESSWTDSSVRPPRVEHWLVSGDHTRNTLTVSIGQKVLKKVVERFTPNGNLYRRDVWTDSTYTIELITGTAVTVIEHELALRGKQGLAEWKRKKQVTRTAAVFKNDSDPACPPSASVIDQSAINAAGATVGPKSDEANISLGNGFRLDGETCRDGASRQRIREATDLVANKLLACLTKHNPKMATKLADQIAKKKPRLRCSKQSPTQIFSDECKAMSGVVYDQCMKERQDSAKNTDGIAGYFHPARPNDMVLVNHDPKGATSAMSPVIAANVFHELMHLAGYAMDSDGKHNQTGADDTFNDEVYGCEALCSVAERDAGKLHLQNCTACISADGNKPSAASEAKCSNLMPMHVVQPIISMRRIDAYLKECAGGKQTSCNKKSGNKLLEVCSAKGLKLGDPACKPLLRKRMREAIDDVEKQPRFDATKAGFDWAQFKAQYKD